MFCTTIQHLIMFNFGKALKDLEAKGSLESQFEEKIIPSPFLSKKFVWFNNLHLLCISKYF